MKNYHKIVKKSYSVEEVIVALILAGGVLLSLLEFLHNRSLWSDDASLALNIIRRDSFGLLKPLDHGQVAPILFLQIEKLFSTLWPNTEYGLRIFPLLCFWASLYFFYKIIKKQLHSTYAIIFALSLWSFNYTLVFYSCEVKQYTSDVLVLLVASYFLLKDYKTERNKYYVLGIFGAIAILVSNVAPIILFMSGLYLLYDQFFVTKEKKIMPLFIIFSVWLSLFSVYYVFFIHNHPLQEFMLNFWSEKKAFLPLDSFRNFAVFLIKKMLMAVSMLSAKNSEFLLIIFFVAGLITFIRGRKTEIIILTCAPITLHLFLSAFQLYPFDTRLILYTLPCLIIICSFGFDTFLKFIFSRLKIEKIQLLAVIIPIVFLLAFLLGKQTVKENRAEIKTSILYIQKNIVEGENIYIHSAALKAFCYYKEIGFVKTNAHLIEGEWNNEKTEVEELRKLKGKCWILFTTYNSSGKFIINQLDSIGYKQIDVFKTTGSSAYLYDFGEQSE
jgi:hypothetical protein